ncbi:hypothetical protein B0H11DRAFT_2195842 [Mycena galericulata]|nr:hypothetical protein B0H11DRAFT_2195842 [Mycena galericulata]
MSTLYKSNRPRARHRSGLAEPGMTVGLGLRQWSSGRAKKAQQHSSQVLRSSAAELAAGELRAGERWPRVGNDRKVGGGIGGGAQPQVVTRTRHPRHAGGFAGRMRGRRAVGHRKGWWWARGRCPASSYYDGTAGGFAGRMRGRRAMGHRKAWWWTRGRCTASSYDDGTAGGFAGRNGGGRAMRMRLKAGKMVVQEREKVATWPSLTVVLFGISGV